MQVLSPPHLSYFTMFKYELCTYTDRDLAPYMQAPPPEKKRKETLLSAELGKFLDKRVRVKFQGGREGESIRLHSQEEGNHFLARESREEGRALPYVLRKDL